MATAGLIGGVSQPQPSGSPVVVNFTDAQASFGFGGRFDTGISDVNRRKWYNNSAWAGYIRGTQCRMPCGGGAASPYRAAVDGGAEFDVQIVAGIVVLFTGLADTWHFVTIKVNAEGGYEGQNNYTPYTGTFLEVTGNRPLLSNQTDIGLIFNLNDPAFLGKHTFCVGTIEDSLVRPQYPRNNRFPGDTLGGCVMVYAKCESLWILGSTRNFWVSIDGAAPYRIDLTALSSVRPRWTKVLSGLDINAFHTYTIIPNDDDVTHSPESIMLGGNGAAIQAFPTPAKRVIMIGDSITCCRNSLSVLQGSMDLYKICAPYKFIGSAAGVAGRDTPTTNTAIASILAAQKGLPDYALVTIGVNDGVNDAPTKATFKTAMRGIVDKLLAAGIPKIAIRRVYQQGTNEATNAADLKNVAIAEIISEVNNANVITFGNFTLNTAIATGGTLDGLHPNEAGYIAMANLEIPMLASFFA